MGLASMNEFWDTVFLLINIQKILSSCNSPMNYSLGYCFLLLVHLHFNGVKFLSTILLKVILFFTLDILVPFKLVPFSFLPPENPTSISCFFKETIITRLRSLQPTRCLFCSVFAMYPLSRSWCIFAVLLLPLSADELMVSYMCQIPNIKVQIG